MRVSIFYNKGRRRRSSSYFHIVHVDQLCYRRVIASEMNFRYVAGI